tara:strand:+ start:3649 stop:3969 length:321 start_codon:yes stop_codon:yes gene_type:complete
MYKALRTLKIDSKMVYQGDMLPENLSDFIDIDVFTAKGWIEQSGPLKTKPIVSKVTTDVVSKNLTAKAKHGKKTSKKIGAILAAKSKEKPAIQNLEAAVLPKPDMD